MSNDPVSEGIRFSSYCLPPLLPGDYKVEVRQEVTALQSKPFEIPAFEFAVAGPRFGLNPADIYSVYPPKGSTGAYGGSLPHAVFTRRTIPWERRLASWPEGRPWMALLLLSAEDFKDEDNKFPNIEPRIVDDLFDPAKLKKDDVAGPNITDLKGYEKEDACNTIDLDAKLFARVAPGADDLDYLAHVREVSTLQKETASFLADGSFSVVIGSRFPKAVEGEGPVENRAVLVSLEGMQEFLPLGTKEPSAKKLRLVVLASWGFHCEKKPDFVASMLALEKEEKNGAGATQRGLEPLRLKFGTEPLPHDATLSAEDAKEALQYLRTAFSRGYTALNHNTRVGAQTVSWYRGPLAPVDIPVRGDYKFRAVPDALVQYDPGRGLMDLTYAGAAQLGRLLGLQDRSFAQSLYEWRAGVEKQIKTDMRKQALRRILRSQPVKQSPRTSPDGEFLESVLIEAMGDDPSKVDEPADSDGDFKKGVEGFKAGLQVTDLPATVRDWLARRVLLYGVPFLYLVPDERMLPMPSMRFFRIDPLWVKRLLEGTCSVGRNSTEGELVDSILADEFFKIAVTGSTKVRQRPSEEAHTGNNAGNTKVSGLPLPAAVFPLDGFLLRSPIVRGWQGLEMKAWKEGMDAPTPPLRIDRLAPDIMLCIFNGPLVKIEIRQPPEGMHFGADNNTKTLLRNVKTPASGKPKPGATVKDVVKIPFRGNDENSRVINVHELADSLQEGLKKHNWMTPKQFKDEDGKIRELPLTSAEFAVQMTKSPGRVTITVGKIL